MGGLKIYIGWKFSFKNHKESKMAQLSELAVCMSDRNRKNQLLCWYTDEIYLCTKNRFTADQIVDECERRKIVCARCWTQGIMFGPDDVYQISIYKSLEKVDDDKDTCKPFCVPALKKKKLADWAIRKYNEYAIGEGRLQKFYDVWIQPGCEGL